MYTILYKFQDVQYIKVNLKVRLARKMQDTAYSTFVT